jgi:hypothetical protein
MTRVLLSILFIYSALLAQSTFVWNQVGKWDITHKKNNLMFAMQHRSQSAFNLCYNKNIHFYNGSISVDFKANHGSIDQGGGIMWRVQDSNNYYVIRFNPLEDNFRFYRVHHGIRSELASTNLHLSQGWHSMKIEQSQNYLKAFLDGKLSLEYSHEFVEKSGGVGVWTKADAQTSFKNLTVTKK